MQIHRYIDAQIIDGQRYRYRWRDTLIYRHRYIDGQIYSYTISIYTDTDTISR